MVAEGGGCLFSSRGIDPRVEPEVACAKLQVTGHFDPKTQESASWSCRRCPQAASQAHPDMGHRPGATAERGLAFTW